MSADYTQKLSPLSAKELLPASRGLVMVRADHHDAKNICFLWFTIPDRMHLVFLLPITRKHVWNMVPFDVVTTARLTASLAIG
jgi:hypothetical protein